MEKFLTLPIGDMISSRLGTSMTTYDIVRLSETMFEINCLSNGWTSANVDIETLNKIISGEMKVYDLDFV